MGVDPTWLARVRATNQQTLGLAGGMGASPDQIVASARPAPAPPPPPPPPPPQQKESSLVRWLLYGAAAIATVGAAATFAVVVWPRRD